MYFLSLFPCCHGDTYARTPPSNQAAHQHAVLKTHMPQQEAILTATAVVHSVETPSSQVLDLIVKIHLLPSYFLLRFTGP